MAQATWDLGRESYWRQVLARWRRSGLSVRAFCRTEGVNKPQFYWESTKKHQHVGRAASLKGPSDARVT